MTTIDESQGPGVYDQCNLFLESLEANNNNVSSTFSGLKNAIEVLQASSSKTPAGIQQEGQLANLYEQLQGGFYPGEIIDVLGKPNSGKSRFVLAAASSVLVADSTAKVQFSF